jgi:hypothetical protein
VLAPSRQIRGDSHISWLLLLNPSSWALHAATVFLTQPDGFLAQPVGFFM